MTLLTILTPLHFLSFLFSPTFWAKTGFFISYIATFLLVLEVVRLASSDAKRKEVERLIDVYAAERSEVDGQRMRKGGVGVKGMMEGQRREEVDMDMDGIEADEDREEVRVSIEQLQEMERMSVVTSSAMEKTSIDTLEEMERRN
ncbi:hypothetical protein A1F94_010169 [Pyrenophora tritici-repentis]|nr:hypothetical protein A1F94_010169 [Pyrenophora tritici-repentis]